MQGYPLFVQIWKAARRAIIVAALVVAFFIVIELARVYLLLHRFNPILAPIYGGALALVLIVAGVRYLCFRNDHRTLYPPRLPEIGQATHKDMRAYCKYLTHYLKRLGENSYLDADHRKRARQAAYDLDDALDAHPLNEDLVLLITKCENETLPALFAPLDAQATALAQLKMKAVVEDVVQPPFPVVNPLVVVFHQITLVSSIVDIYLARPALFERVRVIRDVWHVLSGGDFFRIGQRLFEGVYANSPPVGPVIDDLGQAIASIWLTLTVSQTAIYRCQSIHGWSAEQTIRQLDRQIMDSLIVTRDTLTRDVLPMLKLRIRHRVGPGVADAAGFTESIIQGITKAVDMVVQGLRAHPPEQTAQASRRTHHGAPPPPTSETTPSADRPHRTSSRRRRSHSGVLKMFRTFGQRINYTVRGPR